MAKQFLNFFLEIDQSEIRIAYDSHVCTDWDEMSILHRGPLPYVLPTKFLFIWPSAFRGEDFKKSPNQKQEFPMVAMFVNGLGQNKQSLERNFYRCFLPSFGSFGQAVLDIRFLEIDLCLLTDRDEMSNLNRRPSIEQNRDEMKKSVFGQPVSEKIFRN